MEKNPIVSIIIPIYNGSNYIDKCFDSILKQTYKNIEVVFVNDESKDNSLQILENYSKKYNFIKIINQKNSGQAIARNNGIKNSSGKYITFVDQDDYIDNDYIETLVSNIKDNDILITGYTRVDEKGNVLYKKIPSDLEWAKYKYCSSWSKIYLNSFIKKNKIEFGNYKIGEDVYFLLYACSKTNKIDVLSYSGYNNLRNFSSVSNNINKKKGVNNLMPMINDMKNNLDFSKFDIDLLLYFFLKTVIHYIYNQRKNCSLNEYKKLFNSYYSWLEQLYFENDKKIKFVYMKNEENKVNLLINLFIFFNKIHCIKILLFLLKKLTPDTNK